jgi:hypothetical protein
MNSQRGYFLTWPSLSVFGIDVDLADNVARQVNVVASNPETRHPLSLPIPETWIAPGILVSLSCAFDVGFLRRFYGLADSTLISVLFFYLISEYRAGN